MCAIWYVQQSVCVCVCVCVLEYADKRLPILNQYMGGAAQLEVGIPHGECILGLGFGLQPSSPHTLTLLPSTPHFYRQGTGFRV